MKWSIALRKFLTSTNIVINTMVKALTAAYVGNYLANTINDEEPSLAENPIVFIAMQSLLVIPALRASYVYLKRKYYNIQKHTESNEEFYFNRNLMTVYAYVLSYQITSTLLEKEEDSNSQKLTILLSSLSIATIPAMLNRIAYKMPGRDQNPEKPGKAQQFKMWFERKFSEKQILAMKNTASTISTTMIYGGIGDSILAVHYSGVYGMPVPEKEKVIWGASFMAVGASAELILVLAHKPLKIACDIIMHRLFPLKEDISPETARRIFNRFTVSLKTAIIFTFGILATAGSINGNTNENPSAWVPSPLEIALISGSSIYPALLMQKELFSKLEYRLGYIPNVTPEQITEQELDVISEYDSLALLNKNGGKDNLSPPSAMTLDPSPSTNIPQSFFNEPRLLTQEVKINDFSSV